MDIVNRAKNICLTPNTEWPVIAAEATPPGTIITEYVVPLAAIGAVAGFIGGSLVGTSLGMFGSYRIPLVTGLTLAVFTFVMAIVTCFIISVIINALAPTFGGQKDSNQALKVAVYSFTPAWVAGVLQILPLLGGLIGIIALVGTAAEAIEVVHDEAAGTLPAVAAPFEPEYSVFNRAFELAVAGRVSTGNFVPVLF